MAEIKSDIRHGNFVQVACSRPKMYTANGTLAEVYALLVGYDVSSRTHRPKSNVDQSASLVLGWLRDRASDPRNVVAELLAEYSSDDTALQVIYNYASTLPPAPHTT